MQFYEFGDALRPLGEKAPEKWENVLAILEPEDVALQTSCEKFSYNLQKRNGA